MSKFKLVINSRIDVMVEKKVYKTVIQDVVKDGFLISIPVNEGEYLMLNHHEEVELYNYVDDLSLYKLTCNVIGKVVDNNIPLYKMSLPKDVKKVQRRNYVRVNMLHPIKYVKGDSNNLNDKEMLPALLLDLSGGGMRIKLREELYTGDIISAQLNSDELAINAKGKVVRKEKCNDGRFVYGISFWQLDNISRENIIRSVFKIMRKQRELV